MDRRRAAGALLALAACIACTSAAPTASNQTALDLYESDASEGCYYNFQHYGEGDRIMTNEPCLNCTCHNRMLMCYLRVCPFTKPIGQDCTVEKRADQCCPIVTCPDVPVDLLTSTSTTSPAEYGTTGLGRLDKYGCSMNGKFFPEGAKVPPSPNKPCEHCYCIRNMTTCVMQECTLHVDGCTPIYHKDVCCPVRYSCDHPEDEIPLLDDMTTTVRPTPGFLLTTTTMPSVTQIPQDCVHDDKIFSDGALIKTEKACEHCYCMKGDIVCVVQECGTPMENEGKNCTSLAPREGQCCPDTYICEGDNELQTDDITTLLPPRRTGVEGSGYRNEDEYTVQPTVFEPEVEGSGLEGSGQEGSELEGSGDKEGIEKPVSTSDEALVSEVATSAIPIEKDETDLTETPVYIPISTESSSLASEKYTTEPDKGQNTVPSEDETTVPSVRETTISSDDMHPPEPEKDEKTSAEDGKTETPSEFEQGDKLATTIVPESHSSIPDIIVTSGEMFDNTDKSTPVETITLKQSDESVTDASQILEPLATTTEKQESSETQTVIPLDEKQSKSTTVQLPDEAHEPVDSEQPHEVTTETLVKLSTVDDIKDKDSDTTVPSEQDEPLSTSTSKYEIPETTSINTIENEIQEEVSPIASPGMIPGEGNCLVNGVTYGNDSVVPSTNKCQTNCKCMSSIVKCDPIMCSGPPENMVNCQPVYDTAETCCPTYICDHGKETIPPQPHSQLSGTESPVIQKIDCIGTECRKQGDDVASPTPSPDCLAGDCLTETDTKDSSECGTAGCDVQPAIAEPSKPEVTKQPEVCLDGNCISPPESCVGDNCQLPIDKDQSCGKDGECDVPHKQVCEGPNCDEETKPPKDESPVCDNKDNCGQSAVPEVPVQTCDGEACEPVPIELPSGEVPQAECSDESCTKKEITELENKYGSECKDESCVPHTPEQPISEMDDVNTELPISQDESDVKVPVIAEDEKHTDLPEVVTELPASSVTEVQETVTEPEKMYVTELSTSQEQAMFTKASETVQPSEEDTMVTESLDSETKLGTESPELSATASSKIPEKEAEQEPATEEPLREGPVTEQPEISTKAFEIPSAEEQEIISEYPKVTTAHEPKFNTESPEISEKPEVSEYYTTESQSEIAKTSEIAQSEEHEKTTSLPVTLATETGEVATKAIEISEEETQTVSEPPEIEPIDTVTKMSEGPMSEVYPVPEYHETSTKPSEQLPVTETQEVIKEIETETPDISEIAIDEATKVPQLLVTETQDKSTEVEKTTEIYDKPEYPLTDSAEKVTIAPISEDEKIPESSVTKSQEETSSEKPEASVTETMEPLREGSVTESQNPSTEKAENAATEVPELPVLIKEETPQEPGDKLTEAPETTESAVTESKEKITETEENVTEALKKQETAVTESEEMVTEASKEPQAAVTESEEKITEVPKEPEADVTESDAKLTEGPKESEISVTESEGKVTEAPKEPDAAVTESEENITEAPKEPEAVVTGSEEKLTETPKEPETSIAESEDKVTEAPKEPAAAVTESEEKVPEAPKEPQTTEFEENMTEEPKTPEAGITDFEEKVTVTPKISIEKTTEAGEEKESVTELQEKTTTLPEVLTQVEVQKSPESTITDAQEKATEAPESIISGHVPEESVTESEVKATFAPETSQTSAEQQPCDKDSGCDVSLTKPCEGGDCGIDTPPKEVPMVCNNKDDCEQSSVADVPAQTCDGESCKELPVTDDNQESPVTESKEEVTKASEAPAFGDKQEEPELFVTETQEKATESPKAPLSESDDTAVTESATDQKLEVPVTESDQSIREDLVTEPQEIATKTPETATSQELPYPPATDSEEKATESPELSLSVEKQQTTTSTVTEYSEKQTEAPGVADSEQKPQVSETSVIDLEEKITEAPESSGEKQEMPDQPVTEYTKKVTENPETPPSERETERVPETLVTESAEKATELAEKTTEAPLLDEKQEIPEPTATLLEEKSTDKPLREGSVTESQELATVVSEIPTAAPELPISEQEIDGLVTKPTDTLVSDDKQDIPETPVTDSVTESQEKLTDSSQEQDLLLTEQPVVATKSPTLQDDQQTPESQEMETAAPEIPTEDQDIRGDQPATETQEIITKMPEIVTSGEQDIHTEAPVSLVTGLQEEHAVPVSTVTESQEPTTRIQETSVSEEQQTTMLSKATEAPQEPMSGGQEVPETDQVKATNAPITVKQDIPEESGTESIEKATEISITEPQERTTSTPEVTENPNAPEIQEKETEVPETQEKATETPVIPAIGEKHEYPATESEDMVTPVESEFGEGEKTSKSPVTEFHERVTEIPETIVSEQEPKVPETFVTEADKPLREGSATESQELGTEIPEIPAPEAPESPVLESQPTEAEASATESEEKATMTPEVPVSQEVPQAPETEEKATQIPEASVTEYQGKVTVAPEIPEVQTPETQEKETESPEVPETSEAPVTEYQDKATETPKPMGSEELPQAPETEEIVTKAPEVPLPEEEQETLVTQPQEKATEAPEVPISGQEPESSEAPDTDVQEKATEAPETPAPEDQELSIPSATESQEPASKIPDTLSTEVPKQEYSETTPYLVELEEHTHKIEDELSSMAPEDITTTRIDEKPSEDTEKPIFRPDMETFSVAPTTAQEPLSTEAGSLDSKFGEPSENQEVPKATTITPERTGEKDKEQTSVSDIETEKYTSAPSTEKPFESSISPETSAPEEEPLPSRTTTTKPEEEGTTPALFDKFTKPEPKPTEETFAPEVPKPTTTGQLSDDLPLPEDEAGQFPPSGGTGYGQEPDYVEEDQAFGPGTCRYGGKVYVSAQQIPRDDPCDFCFCFRSDIICLQQSCPPPIHGCHEEPISGFCCPRYECPVSMATTLNVTTTTTTTTTTLPPHFLPHAYKGQAQRRGCQIKGHTYKVGEVVRASSGPCLHCTCGGDGQMKCDPKQCTPEPMLRQMIAAAVSAKRRR